MLNENKGNDFDFNDKLPFLKNVKNNNYTFPKWIIPISNNTKKLYIGEEDSSAEDVVGVNFKDELDAKLELLQTNTDYESMVTTLLKQHHSTIKMIA